MPELLKLKTPDWELCIWCSDITKRQQAYQRTMAVRGQHENVGCELRFSMPVKIEVLDSPVVDSYPVPPFPENSQVIILGAPIFFENMQYQFEWVFSRSDVSNAATEHKLKGVNDAFRFVASKAGTDLPRLTGVINTGNDIGWLRLPWSYESDNRLQRLALSFEVLPVKMDLHSDLPAMYKSIDAEFPLWRFSLAQRTEQSVSRSKSRGNFPLLWLAHFESLRTKFFAGLKIISNAPHSRLQSIDRNVKADRLKGKISNKLAERVVTDLKEKISHKHYQQDKKVLSVNTPENQFIKMVVDTTKQRLADFHQKLLVNNKAPEDQRISESFLNTIHDWQQPLLRMQTQSFLREVDKFTGISGESLVLQQKTGYSAVYKTWQELKFYLDVFAAQSTVSMKSVAAIYEIWCFLELRKILVDRLEFNEFLSEKNRMKLKDFEYQLTDGFAGAIEFERKDGVKVRLAHEPVFKKNTKTIRTFWVTQKPDILMEVTFPNGKKCIWLFDAKYRIKSPELAEDSESAEDYGNAEHIDYVPEDALNQMHRYRDALIHIKTDEFNSEFKSRPVFGAFALYPGFFDQTNEVNPYFDVIRETGIGAFALLPSANSQIGSAWLFQYLKSQIGLPIAAYEANKTSEELFVQESARIPYYGMKQVLYPDLLMTAALGGKSGKKPQYFEAFENGSAKFYHTKLSTFNNKYKQHVVQEIKFLAIAVNSLTDSSTKTIQWIWPVNKVSVVPRNKITEVQSGSSSEETENYYLFYLGKAFRLKDPISRVPHAPIKNTFKLTTLSYIEKIYQFTDVVKVYEDAFLTRNT
jgi:uncharacterized protein